MCRYLLIWKQPRPQGFSLKKWVGPFFKGKALGTRLIWKRTVHRMAGSNSGRPVTTSVIDLVHSLSIIPHKVMRILGGRLLEPRLRASLRKHPFLLAKSP